MKSIFLSVLLVGNIYANQTNTMYLDDLSLEELMSIKIYSASKSYQSIEEIPANITVLTRKDIEKYNYTTLDELIKHIPGLFLIDDSEHFQIGSRGSLGSSFKLMINNNVVSPLRIPRGGTSNRNFFATPIKAIDRIEIIKGPQAVTHGNNSMYGSINIITNDFHSNNIVSISKGNNNQSSLFLRLNHHNENGGFTLNTSFYNTRGIKGELKNSFDEEYFEKREAKYPSANKSLTSLLSNQYKTFDFSYRYKNLTSDITYSKTNYGTFIEPNFRNGIQVEQIEKSIALTYEDEINDNLEYKLNYILSQKNYDIEDFAVISENKTPAFNYAKDTRNNFDFHLNFLLNDNIKILIGNTFQYISSDFYGKAGIYAHEHSYNLITNDLYSKIEYKFNNKLELNIGLRNTKRKNFIISYNKHNQKQKKEEQLLPEISTIYHLDRNNHIKLLFGKATQLSYSSIDNYESIKSLELSYLYINKYFLINSSIFYNNTENISLFTQKEIAGKPKVIKDELDSKGIELALTYKASESFQTSTSLTYQKSKSASKNKNINLEPAFSPEVLVKADISYLANKLRYSASLDYISSMQSSIINDDNKRYGEKVKNNITLNSNISYKYNKNLSFDLYINNILNKKNKIPAGSTLTSFKKGFFTKERETLFTIKYTF